MSESAISAKPTIARCVGRAIGIVWRAIRTPVARSTVEVQRKTETHEHDGITLRRTTIDEVVFPKSPHAD